MLRWCVIGGDGHLDISNGTVPADKSEGLIPKNQKIFGNAVIMADDWFCSGL